MSTYRRMDKGAVHIHKAILPCYKKECIWVSSSEVDEHRAYYTVRMCLLCGRWMWWGQLAHRSHHIFYLHDAAPAISLFGIPLPQRLWFSAKSRPTLVCRGFSSFLYVYLDSIVRYTIHLGCVFSFLLLLCIYAIVFVSIYLYMYMWFFAILHIHNTYYIYK